MTRSFDRFSQDDLHHLCEIAEANLLRFVEQNPQHRSLVNHRIAALLCQGAALHNVDGKNGVKDFDVWTFFRQTSASPDYPPRLLHEGRFERESLRESSRWVDLLGRSIPASPGERPLETIRRYILTSLNATPRELRKKVGVVLWPAESRGQALWNPSNP